MSPVRVIHASYVDVPATAMVSPEPIKLTAMEAQWVVVPVLQHVLLYEGEGLPHFNDVLQSLSSSLAATLRSFAPLAGKLEEVRKKTEDPMAGCNFLAPAFTVAMERLMNVSGASSFRAYELADFGWGRPRRTENTRMNRDGQVALMRARDGLGVQVSVSLLEPAQMAEFKSQLLELVG
ncbi:hypothetical protein TRIUR3_05761 [Triticum urartu]|uniref:Anthocyanin 5-aromatic acyltransferase n=1 Tax=Triticum urartu TaxID=4572 RepID=M8AIE0_TRIUA|nr:hypothetical protein TRIUR3_05761 [Triticum urartu]